jgi:NAD(P)-dependent dehydrogenase (short-subunit alcohol dehydrogenase family)
MQDNTRLTGKVAIITGAGSRNPGAGATNIGNGRAIAVLMAMRGAKVLLLDVDRAALEETARLTPEDSALRSRLPTIPVSLRRSCRTRGGWRTSHARIPFTTSPWMSVRRKSRP